MEFNTDVLYNVSSFSIFWINDNLYLFVFVFMTLMSMYSQFCHYVINDIVTKKAKF